MTFRFSCITIFSIFSFWVTASEPIIGILHIEGAGDDKHKTLTLSVENPSGEDYDLILHQGQIAYDPSNYNTQELVINCVDEYFLTQQKIEYKVGVSSKPNLKKWHIKINKNTKIKIKLECYCFEPGFDLSSKNLKFKFLPGELLSREEITDSKNCTITQKEYHKEAVEENLIKEFNNIVFEYSEPILKSYSKEKFAQFFESAIIDGLNREFTQLYRKKISCEFFKDWSDGYVESILDNYFDSNYRLRPDQLSICLGHTHCIEPDIILKNIVYINHEIYKDGYKIKFTADVSTSKDLIAKKLQKNKNK